MKAPRISRDTEAHIKEATSDMGVGAAAENGPLCFNDLFSAAADKGASKKVGMINKPSPVRC